MLLLFILIPINQSGCLEPVEWNRVMTFNLY